MASRLSSPEANLVRPSRERLAELTRWALREREDADRLAHLSRQHRTFVHEEAHAKVRGYWDDVLKLLQEADDRAAQREEIPPLCPCPVNRCEHKIESSCREMACRMRALELSRFSPGTNASPAHPSFAPAQILLERRGNDWVAYRSDKSAPILRPVPGNTHPASAARWPTAEKAIRELTEWFAPAPIEVTRRE